ncbi:2',3'-cyclic-nucleotide 2'-phosphodiesterase, partial [Vibrio parahaemolyticus]|nr:2',3'-cyclic-nucleotide 2'-phosphodiesterase [Vibrio parahaemolyticus]
MPGRWGRHVGVMDLVIEQKDGQWPVVEGQSEARPMFDKATKKSLAEADQGIIKALEGDHKCTREFVNQPIGKANDVMYSFLALVQDDP